MWKNKKRVAAAATFRLIVYELGNAHSFDIIYWGGFAGCRLVYPLINAARMHAAFPFFAPRCLVQIIPPVEQSWNCESGCSVGIGCRLDCCSCIMLHSISRHNAPIANWYTRRTRELSLSFASHWSRTHAACKTSRTERTPNRWGGFAPPDPSILLFRFLHSNDVKFFRWLAVGCFLNNGIGGVEIAEFFCSNCCLLSRNPRWNLIMHFWRISIYCRNLNLWLCCKILRVDFLVYCTCRNRSQRLLTKAI